MTPTVLSYDAAGQGDITSYSPYRVMNPLSPADALTKTTPYLISFCPAKQHAKPRELRKEKGAAVHPDRRGKEARKSNKEARGISEIAGATCSKTETVAPGFLGPSRWNCTQPGRDEVLVGQVRARAKVELKIVE